MCNLYRLTRAADEVAKWFDAANELGGANFGQHRRIVPGLDLLLRLECHFLLAVIVIEENALILATECFACWGVALPEMIEQFREGDLLWIKVDLDDFRVIPDLFVGGVFLCASAVSDSSSDDSR